MLRLFLAAVLLIPSLAAAVEPPKYEPIPAEKLAEYKKLDGFASAYYWNREVSLTFSATWKSEPGFIPSVTFFIKKDAAFPTIPDAGIPFVLGLHDNVNDAAIKQVAKLPNLIGLVLVSTNVTDVGLQELKAAKNLKYFAAYSPESMTEAGSRLSPASRNSRTWNSTRRRSGRTSPRSRNSPSWKSPGSASPASPIPVSST
jgi:hypothetical protein